MKSQTEIQDIQVKENKKPYKSLIWAWLSENAFVISIKIIQ